MCYRCVGNWLFDYNMFLCTRCRFLNHRCCWQTLHALWHQYVLIHNASRWTRLAASSIQIRSWGVTRLNNQPARVRTDRTLVAYASFSATREYFNFVPLVEQNIVYSSVVMVRFASPARCLIWRPYGAVLCCWPINDWKLLKAGPMNDADWLLSVATVSKWWRT